MGLPPTVGFIGFGEAGFTIGGGLRGAGIAQLYAFDVATDAPDRGPLIRRRARESGVSLVGSSAELVASSDLIFSTVTSSAALEAAQQAAPFLSSRAVYADLNSVSPAVKRAIAAVVGDRGASFVEVAVMAPVRPYAHRVPMLAGGPAARSFAEALAPYGMSIEVLSETVGAAAAVKMCRSIVVKGLEALLCECALAARQYEADARVFASLQESYPGIDWTQLADYAAGRIVVHGERRAREMEEVAETLRAVGVEPIMSEATARRQDWSVRLNLKARCGPEGPRTYREMVEAADSL